MKIFSRFLSLLIISGLSLFYAGCGGSSSSTDPAEKVQLAKLSTTWTIYSATLDGAVRTGDFDKLTLTVGGTFSTATPKGPYTYTCGGTRPNPSPWPASGTWKFGSDAKTDLLRNDPDGDLAMTYEATDTQLTITFNFTGTGFAGSRANQVVGNWEFVFKK